MSETTNTEATETPAELTEQVDMLGGGFSFLVTHEQLAEVLDLGHSMIGKLRDEGMPQVRRGVYDLRACVGWYVDKWRRAKPATSSDEMTTRSALNVAQRERIELEMARARGELLPIGEARALLQVVATIIASRLEGMPSRLADTLALKRTPDLIRDELAGEVRSIREQIAGAVRQARAELLPALDVKAAPAPRRRRKSAA